jgi:hypothetical protein
MDKLDTDLAQFRKAFNDRILYVSSAFYSLRAETIITVQLFPPIARNLRLGAAFVLDYHHSCIAYYSPRSPRSLGTTVLQKLFRRPRLNKRT